LSENGVKPLFVVLNEAVGPTQKMDQFKPVQVQSELNGTLSAQFVPHRGSGDFSNWSMSSGFVEIPAQLEKTPPGKVVQYYPWNLFMLT